MKTQALLSISFVASLFLISINALAAGNESPAAEMDNLIALDQYQQAYDLGKAVLDEWEGDP